MNISDMFLSSNRLEEQINQEILQKFPSEEKTIDKLPVHSNQTLKTDICEQLRVKSDPFLEIEKLLETLINYEQSSYTILYVKDEELSYYMPYFPYGSYSHGPSVIELIKKKVQQLKDFYVEQPKKYHWKGLKIARKVLNGLEKITENYPKCSSYDPFIEELTLIQTDLKNFITHESQKLNEAVTLFLNHSKEATIFDLLALSAEYYEKKLLFSVLSRSYGERLVLEVFHLGLEDSEKIHYEHAYSLLFAIANMVTEKDLRSAYHRSPKKDSHGEEISFDDLEKQDVLKIFLSFHQAPNGDHLLNYFEIPFSLDKYEIDDTFIKNFSAKNTQEQNLLNHISIYADILSAKIWNSKQILHMPLVKMYDQLNLFVDHFKNSQLFHTDRYISFLNIAATAIAYLKSCQHHEEIQAKLPLIIDLFDEIVDHAEEIYPAGYTEQYKSDWLNLIGHLKDAIRDENKNLDPYFLSLFSHPLQDTQSKLKTLQCREKLQPMEFLARKAAYWNRYFQNQDLYYDQNNVLINPDLLSHRKESLFPIYQNGEMLLYEIADIIVREGFVCQILIPFDKKRHAQNKTFIPIIITFQGTIEHQNSINRDCNLKGAGYDLWQKEKLKLVIPELKKVMTQIKNSYGHQLQFDLSFVGHSLGGSDAQNALSFLIEAFKRRNIEAAYIQHIFLYTFHTAGVPNDTLIRFNQNVGDYLEKIQMLSHTIVKNDIVSKTCQGKLGKDFPEKDKISILEISNRGCFYVTMNHCDYVHAWANNILPHKLLDPVKDKNSIQKYLKGMTHSWTDLKEHTTDLISSSPAAQIATGIITGTGLLFANFYLALAAQNLMHLSGGYLRGGINIASSAGDSYTKNLLQESVCDIWEAFTKKWYGTQIREGTG